MLFLVGVYVVDGGDPVFRHLRPPDTRTLEGLIQKICHRVEAYLERQPSNNAFRKRPIHPHPQTTPFSLQDMGFIVTIRLRQGYFARERQRNKG